MRLGAKPSLDHSMAGRSSALVWQGRTTVSPARAWTFAGSLSPEASASKNTKKRWSCLVVRLKPATNKIHLCCKSLLHLIVLSNIPFHSVFTFSFCIQLSCVYCFSYKTCPATYAVSSLRLGVVKRTPALIQNLESDYASQQFYEIACNKRWYYTSVGITWCQSSSTIRSWHRHAACSLGSETGYRTVRL